MVRHRIKFKYNNDQDDYSINLAFSKKEIESRKDWLTNWMEECKRRKELGLSEIYLYEKDTKAVSYQVGSCSTSTSRSQCRIDIQLLTTNSYRISSTKS